MRTHILLYGGAHKPQAMKRSNNSDNYRDRSNNNTDYVYYPARVYNNSDSD